jgi:DNA-binding MarR family transcriptional regulator
MTTADQAGARWLTPDEERAWRAYRRMQTVLPVALARDLARDSGLSDPDYDVLSTLSEQPGHRWQLRDLAARMLWSRSRLSHHLARMEKRGLVTREPDPDDGRNAVVVLTDRGFATLQDAAPAHVESVRRHLVDLATPEELAALRALAERVVAEVGDLSSRLG